MKEGRDVWYHEICEQADAECPCEELDAETPMFILYSSGSTAKPKGILHTTGGYLTGVKWTTKYVFDLKDDDIYWCAADVGWVTGHSYIVYGPLSNGATCVMYEGAPDYPAKDIHWELVEKLGVTIYYYAPTAIRGVHEVGARASPEARPLEPAPARHGRRADQPEGLAVVPPRHRRRALPDRRYLVADRDRPRDDLAAARHHPQQARFGLAAAARHRRRGPRRVRWRADRGGPGPARAHPALAGDAAHPLPGRRPL